MSCKPGPNVPLDADLLLSGEPQQVLVRRDDDQEAPEKESYRRLGYAVAIASGHLDSCWWWRRGAWDSVTAITRQP